MKILFQEIGAILGVAASLYGVFQIYEPLAFVFGGAFLFYFCLPVKGNK